MYPPKPPDLDDNFKPIQVGNKPPDLDDTGNPVSDQPSMLSNAWHAISSPLWEGPSKLASMVAEPMMQYGESDQGLLNKGALYGGAYLQSLGNQISGLTSPLNVGTMGMASAETAAAKAGLPTIAKALGYGTKTVGAGMMAHGGQQIYKGENLSDKLMGGVEALTGYFGVKGRPEITPRESIPTPKPTPIPENIPAPELAPNISRVVLKRPTMDMVSRLTDEGFIASDTTPEGGVVMIRPPKQNVDPNLNQGMGNPELAGSTPYKTTSQLPSEFQAAPDYPEGQNPLFAEHYARQQRLRQIGDEIVNPDIQELDNIFASPEMQQPINVDGPIEPEGKYVQQTIDPHAAMKAAMEGPTNTDFLDHIHQMDREAAPPPEPVLPGGNEFSPDIQQITEPADFGGTTQRFEPPQPEITHQTAQQTAENISKNPDRTGTMSVAELMKLEGEDGGGILNDVEQPRLDALRNDIAKQGIKDPLEITVSRNTEGEWKGKYVLDEGHHRLGIANELGLKNVPVKVTGNRPSLISQFMKSEEGSFDPNFLNKDPNSQIMTPEQIRDLIKQQGGKPPILESDVGSTRPTAATMRGQLGPKTDLKKASPIVEAFNLSRALKASIDFSAPLRQGIGLIHKKEFWKSLGPMFKSWASEEGFQASQKAIEERPLFRPRAGRNGKLYSSFADDAGLKLTDLTNLNSREEALMSTWAEKVPGVRASNRAYTAFLNNLRADTFESLVRDGGIFGADAKANVPLARALADFVNTASGRGSLGRLESSAVTLNTMFFAPRLIASRLKMLNPAYYVMANPMVRKEALKSLFAITAAGNSITTLAKMAGAEVGLDPSSSDFGKAKIGNVRIDPFAGFQQYVVAANRLLNPMGPATGFEGETPITRGQMITSSTSGNQYDLWNKSPGPYDPTWMSTLGRFARGKMHPTLGFAYDLASGMKDMAGKPYNFSTMNPMENGITQQFIPLLIQDVYQLAQEDPKLGLILGPPAAFGMGVQTYGSDSMSNAGYR